MSGASVRLSWFIWNSHSKSEITRRPFTIVFAPYLRANSTTSSAKTSTSTLSLARERLFEERDPFLDREHRPLVARLAHDADDDAVEDLRGAADDVDVPVCDRVVTCPGNGDAATHSWRVEDRHARRAVRRDGALLRGSSGSVSPRSRGRAGRPRRARAAGVGERLERCNSLVRRIDEDEVVRCAFWAKIGRVLQTTCAPVRPSFSRLRVDRRGTRRGRTRRRRALAAPREAPRAPSRPSRRRGRARRAPSTDPRLKTPLERGRMSAACREPFGASMRCALARAGDDSHGSGYAGAGLVAEDARRLSSSSGPSYVDERVPLRARAARAAAGRRGGA